MVKIQIDLSKEENRIVELIQADNGLATKEIAIKEMISLFPLKIKKLKR